jgi:hypothetical protein
MWRKFAKTKKYTNVVPNFNHNGIIFLLHFENLCHPSHKFVNLQMEIYKQNDKWEWTRVNIIIYCTIQYLLFGHIHNVRSHYKCNYYVFHII